MDGLVSLAWYYWLALALVALYATWQLSRIEGWPNLFSITLFFILFIPFLLFGVIGWLADRILGLLGL